MSDDKKKVIIDVLVEASESIKQISEMRKTVTDLKAAQKELDLTTEEGRIKYEKYAAEIRTVSGDIRKKNKEIDNSIKQSASEKNSLDSLSASLAKMKAEYRAMGDIQREAAEGTALRDSILATNDALRVTEQGYGQYARNAADYRKANQKLTNELKQLEKELLNTSLKFLNLSEAEKKAEAGQELINKMADLREKIDDAGISLDGLLVKQQSYTQNIIGVISNNNSLLGTFTNITASSKGVGGAFQAMKSQALVFGKALLSLAVNPVVLTLVAIVAACALLAKAFQRNEENGDKLNIVFAKVGAIFKWLLKVLEPIATFLVDNLIVAFDALSDAVEWVIEKIASVMEFLGMESAAKWVRDTTESIKEMTKAAEEMSKAETKLRKDQRASEKIQKDYQKRAEKLRQIRDDDTKSIGERIKANNELGKVLKDQLKEELRIAQEALDVANLRIQLEGQTTENLNAQAEAMTKISDIQERITGQESEQIKNTTSLQKEAAAKALDSQTKILELKKSTSEALIRAEADFQTTDFAKRQEYDRRLQKLSVDTQKERLSLQRKYGKINQKEYDAQLSILDAQQKEFNNNQVKGLNNYFKEQITSIASMVDKSLDSQIDDVKKKYNKAIEDLNNIQEPVKLEGQSDEDFEKEYAAYKNLMLEKAELEKKLEEKLAKEIADIQDVNLKKRVEDIEKTVSKQYEGDLAKFTDNEREKNKIQTDALKETIRKKKEANISTAADEAQLRTLSSQANQIQLNTELLQANGNALAKYKARKKYLEQEAKIYKDNADKLMGINKQLKDNDKDLLMARIQNFEEWSSKTLNALSSVNEIANALSDADIQKYEEDNERKKDALQARLDQGLISQEQYDAQIAQADALLEKKKADVARKQAIREKALKVFEVGMNTAAAIMKNTAELGLLPAIPVNIATGVLGALQLATIIATPLPKAAKGGLIGGKPHSQGGTIIEAERGEAIMNKRSVSMFAPLLSMINEMGGGIPFAKPMSDGGFSSRLVLNSSNTGISKKDMEDVINNFKVYTTVEDYRRADTQYTEIRDRGMF